MKKIIICHLSAAHSRYDKRILMKECISLSEAMYEVTLLVADGKPSETINGVKIKSVDISKGSWWLGQGEWLIEGKIRKSRDVTIINRIKREINTYKYMLDDAISVGAEIYHIHEPVLLPLGVKLKSFGKKVVFDSHENYPEQIKTKKSIPIIIRKLISMIYKKYETYVTKRIDAVIVPCTFYNGINIFEGRCKRIEIISNAPKISDFPDINIDRQKINKFYEHKICYAGGLTHERGITHLIKAAYKAEVKLSLAGIYAPTGYKEKLEKMSEYSCVDYNGQLKYSDLIELYKQSSIGVSTLLNVGQNNTADNFTTKVYEYMLMGLPVIISKFIFAERILRKFNFGVAVDPENIDEIADAINYIIDNPNIARSMGQNGKLAVLQELNWAVEEKKLFKLYNDLLI